MAGNAVREAALMLYRLGKIVQDQMLQENGNIPPTSVHHEVMEEIPKATLPDFYPTFGQTEHHCTRMPEPSAG